MATLNTYLNFNGNTEEAFNFYKSVFGGEFQAIQRFKEIPGDNPLPGSDGEKIMHIALPVGKGSMLMATDTIDSMGQRVKPGTNMHIIIDTETKEEARRLFDGLSAGGEITMPLEDAFWGSYYGTFTDKFGIQWMINFDYETK